MMIIGCDLHTRYQQVAMLDTETGELVERRLEHETGEARAFYAALQGPVRVGIEATGYTHWFEGLLAGGRPFRVLDLHSTSRISGGPSLRFLQGREYILPGSTSLGDTIPKRNLSHPSFTWTNPASPSA